MIPSKMSGHPSIKSILFFSPSSNPPPHPPCRPLLISHPSSSVPHPPPPPFPPTRPTPTLPSPPRCAQKHDSIRVPGCWQSWRCWCIGKGASALVFLFVYARVFRSTNGRVRRRVGRGLKLSVDVTRVSIRLIRRHITLVVNDVSETDGTKGGWAHTRCKCMCRQRRRLLRIGTRASPGFGTRASTARVWTWQVTSPFKPAPPPLPRPASPFSPRGYKPDAFAYTRRCF